MAGSSVTRHPEGFTTADVEGKMNQNDTSAERVTIVLHSGDMDKVYSALIIGNGALAMGMEASIYFTFCWAWASG